MKKEDQNEQRKRVSLELSYHSLFVDMCRVWWVL